jgi:cell division septal protein FtsQ
MRTHKYKKPYRVRRKISILKNKIFRLGALFLFFFACIFYVIYFLPFFQIEKINISGCQKVMVQDLKLAIEDKIEKKILFAETKSIFLVDSSKIISDILVEFPQIDKIDFKKQLADKVSIFVKERNPLAVFQQNKKYFLVDESGIIFEEISEQDVSLFRINNNIFGVEAELGQNVVSEELIRKIIDINDKLKKNDGLSVEEFSIISEQRMNVGVSEGWQIYFNLKSDMDWQITELEAILQNKISAQNRRKLNYIDLRFDRVFISPEGLISN